MAEELHRKHRPQYLKDVIGQSEAVKALDGIIERNDMHCFIFTGPSGCGKTTLARIAAAEFDCDPINLIEIDAATNSGADAMRAIQEPLRYRPFGEARARAVIIDECHSLSKQAWQTLLKGTEEPNDFVYWFFCTTEPGKVPATMRTRAANIQLKPVDEELLHQLCEKVCRLEKIELAKGVQDVLISSAQGSPRALLTGLALVRDCETRAGAAALLKQVVDEEQTLKLCQMLVGQKPSWKAAMALVEEMAEENPEGVRIQVMRYLAKAAMGATSNEKATALLDKMQNWERPFNESEGNAPLLLAIGRSILL